MSPKPCTAYRGLLLKYFLYSNPDEQYFGNRFQLLFRMLFDKKAIILTEIDCFHKAKV